MAWPWGKKAIAVATKVKEVAMGWTSGGTGSDVSREAKAIAREYYRNMYLWVCVDKISTTAGVPPIYIKTEKERQLTAFEAKVQELLDNPNPQWTRAKLLEYLAICLATTSRAFVQVIRGVGAAPIELWPLNPLLVTVEYHEGTSTIKQFKYAPNASSMKTFAVEADGSSDIIFIQRPALNSCDAAASPAEVAVPAAEVFNRILQKAADVAGNASNVTGVLSAEADIDQTQVNAVKAKLDEFKTGGRNSGDVLVVANAQWKFDRLTEDPSKILAVEIKDSLARDTCVVMGVPAQLVSIPGSQTYANYEMAMTAFITETIIPRYLGPITHEMTRGLLRTPQAGAQSRTAFITFDIDAWPAVVRARLALAETANKADFLSFDEKRELLGYPKLDDKEAGEMVPAIEKLRIERLKAEAGIGEAAGVNEAQT